MTIITRDQLPILPQEDETESQLFASCTHPCDCCLSRPYMTYSLHENPPDWLKAADFSQRYRLQGAHCGRVILTEFPLKTVEKYWKSTPPNSITGLSKKDETMLYIVQTITPRHQCLTYPFSQTQSSQRASLRGSFFPRELFWWPEVFSLQYANESNSLIDNRHVSWSMARNKTGFVK